MTQKVCFHGLKSANRKMETDGGLCSAGHTASIGNEASMFGFLIRHYLGNLGHPRMELVPKNARLVAEMICRWQKKAAHRSAPLIFEYVLERLEDELLKPWLLLGEGSEG